MLEDRYIWCRNCNEIHHVNPFDQAPAYVADRGEVREQPRDDWRAFMQRHAGHRLEGLRGIGDKYFPTGQTMDPMKGGYLEVTNGQEWFVVHSFRNSIEQPLAFELIRGRLRTAGVTVSIQENAIRKEMKRHFSWLPSGRPSENKSEIFLRILSEVVQELNPRDMEICGYDYGDSSISYGLLDRHTVETVMDRCLPYFTPAELEGLKRFIETHREADDVMALIIKHQYQIEESRK